MRVVADAAAMERERGFAQSVRVYAGHANVNGLCLHVQTMLSDTLSVCAKKIIGARCAVSANNVDLAARMAHSSGQLLEEIKKFRAKVADVTGAIVAQEVIQFLQSAGDVMVSLAVHNVNVFVGVCLVKPQAVLRQRLNSRRAIER